MKLNFMSIGIVVLAAGSSSRMKQSKQLLPINQETLLHRAARAALDSGADHIAVVLGANPNAHQKIIKSLPVHIVLNKTWETGMGSSIKEGLQYLISLYNIEAVGIMVCDQPKVNGTHLLSLIDKFKASDKSIVASYYNDLPGVPAIFGRHHFNEILQLTDHEGAKGIILKNHAKTVLVNFPEGSIDLDTPEDYEQHLKTCQ
jgi:molybdenum cofactor cytidylyltransferase